ncbi:MULTISPECIES: DUF2723 domain-containing protein [Flavobacterium]|uniref:Protein O-mannosyl-transferase family n=1 Tax=Flavobacterium jumunjinense TaxID=998845 RepID=A0ABV5GLA1_9FLAO|nr:MULTISPECIES: DUF2723 domain-containing protein [Flavobacterium]
MKKSKKFIEVILFALVFLVYLFSASKTITFWDSAEFVTSNYHLQVTHPPGASFYTLLCNFIMLFFPASWVALISAMLSAFFGALTVVFLYRITQLIALRIVQKDSSKQVLILTHLCGLLAASTLAFSNTFWTVATETEVYTLSSFLLLLTFYLMILWNDCNNVVQSRRLMFFLLFVLGISIGVHLINLSVIIPLSILYVNKKKNLGWKQIVVSLFLSVFLFLFIYNIGIQGFLKIASFVDVKLVNNYNLPVNSGLFILIVLFLFMVFYGLNRAKKKKNIRIYNIILGTLFFAIGTSTYIIPILRKDVVTPFSNSIETSNQLLNYLKAKQFGVDNTPLVKGTIFNAPLDKDLPFLNDEEILTYNQESQKYEVVDDGKYSKINYANEYDMFFPRMYSQKPLSAVGYSNWVAIKGEKISYPVQGKMTDLLKPTFSENLQFFKNYQVEWMYLRYLYWNFIGKQNENKGTGEIFNGNWISGFNFIDKSRIGDETVIPSRYKNDKSNDAYYFLPFMLGLIGLWSLRKNKAYLITTVVFFLTFGIGITIYLNPLPESVLVRERDYIFLGSFLIFSMWVGFSILTLNEWLTKIKSQQIRVTIISLFVLLASPLQLLAKNWNNHQRSNDTFAYELAEKYLDSCPKGAILITNGDNFTFPLWYLQEVESYRDDIRVINYDQLNIENYIDKLKCKSLNSEPLKVSFLRENYIEGTPKLFPLKKETEKPVDLSQLFQFLNNEKTKINWNGKQQHYIPGDLFSINVDTIKKVFSNFNIKELKANYNSKILFKYSKNFYQLKDIMLFNIIQENINEKPICFAINGATDHYVGFQNNLIHRGFVEQLIPIVRDSKVLNPKIVALNLCDEILMKGVSFEELKTKTNFIKSENIEYTQIILRKNYYFLAQALIEEGKNKEAKQVLDKCMTMFPNYTIPFKQYSFALGKLYYRIGEKQKGNEVCLLSMKNIWEELQWITSFNPEVNQIINVKKAVKIKDIYLQMINQLNHYNQEEAKKKMIEADSFVKRFSIWEIKNSPY